MVLLQSSSADGVAEAPPSDLRSLLEAYERGVILAALGAVGGRQRSAAALLRILPTTLHEKMRRLGIRPQRVHAGSAPAAQEEQACLEWRGAVPPGGTLELRGLNGPVRIEAGADDRVEVKAVRRGDRRAFAAVEVKVVEHGRGVTVCVVCQGFDAAVSARIHGRLSRGVSGVRVDLVARVLYSLVDGRARTATELAVLADVTPSTASVHLRRLLAQRLVTLLAQGRHRYYRLNQAAAQALEALSVLAGGTRGALAPSAPHPLRAARTCYDHIAGNLGVSLHDRILALRWLCPGSGELGYELTAQGTKGLETLRIDVDATRTLRRRLAFPCLDWSERRHHLGGALGAALLATALKRRWLTRDLDSRALSLTRFGQREMQSRFGLSIPLHP